MDGEESMGRSTESYYLGKRTTRAAPFMMGGYGGYGMGWFGGIFMILFWVAVIAGLFLLVRWVATTSRKGGREHHDDSPLEILKRRYARGEINKEEFERMKKDLS